MLALELQEQASGGEQPESDELAASLPGPLQQVEAERSGGHLGLVEAVERERVQVRVGLLQRQVLYEVAGSWSSCEQNLARAPRGLLGGLGGSAQQAERRLGQLGEEHHHTRVTARSAEEAGGEKRLHPELEREKAE